MEQFDNSEDEDNDCDDRFDFAHATRNYWKISNDDFAKLRNTDELLTDDHPENKEFHKWLTVDERRRWNHRYTRGFIIFEKCLTSELLQFCEQRHIAVPENATREELIATLEEADEKRSFHHFEKLPPELRLKVYEIHFRSLDGTEPDKAEPPRVSPPITRASRLLRKESLPAFFDTTRFTFCVNDLPWPKAAAARLPPKGVHAILPRFFSHTSDENIARIKHLKIESYGAGRYGVGPNDSDASFGLPPGFWAGHEYIAWLVDLPSEQQPAEVQLVEATMSSHAWLDVNHMAYVGAITVRLRKFFDGFSSRTEGSALRRDDAWRITSIATQCYI